MPGMDFPASPTAGQLFISPTNGVTYQWSTTYTAWLPLSVTGAGQGDFMANWLASGFTSTPTTVLFANVISGNAGGWYNSANGRYTPPAGRYHIFASVAGSNSGAALTETVNIRKNGTNVYSNAASTSAANFYGYVFIDGNFDANGTDWFDIQVACSSTSNVAQWSWFGAFPITGAAQPAGTGSAWRQIGRVVPTAGLAAVNFQNLPADINDLELMFDVTPATNAVDLIVQFYDNTGTLDSTTGHYNYSKVLSLSSATSGAAPNSYNHNTDSYTAGIIPNIAGQVGNTTGIRGRATVPNIRDARPKSADWQCNYIDSAASAFRQVVGSGQRATATAITGVRLAFSNGNFAAGGAISLWGSP